MERPRLSQKEAAAACGVSLSTIRRYRDGGRFPGAERDPVRGWLIPVEDLLAAGLRVNAPAPPDEQPVSEGDRSPAAPAAELLSELAQERHRRQLAEAEAQHLRETVTRQDEHLADLRRSLLALAPGPAAEPVNTPEPPTAPAQSEGHEHGQEQGGGRTGRRWFRRR
ncbi:helix-turn-helix domain-containing protein [Streptomyces malaysiensis]|uniref:helix-turn-helix domain-containing protein n=1 Tax=Streptomyces malaysiensis TaxID=92644 RepID=UPI000BFC7F18|nr:helix-turn-helix domain-containing protein [Streptomyces malaysiensis]ATL80257.1 hypothetical protein SMALA_0012 [Streptomyces malaysiensis]